jgi:hypothetical protein
MGGGGTIYYDNVQVKYISSQKEEDSRDRVYTVNADNMYSDNDSIEIYLSDSVYANTQQLWKNTLSLGSAVAANTWSVADSYLKNLYKLFIDTYIATYMRPAICYQGTMRGQFNYYKALYDGTRRAHGTSVMYNLEESSWSGEWVGINSPGYSEELVTDFTNGSGGYTFTTFTDNGDLTFTAAYNNVGGSPETKKAILNNITTESESKYRIEVSIVDNGTSSAQIDLVWDTQSETNLSDGDLFYMNSVSPAAAPYFNVIVPPASSANYTIGISIKKHYGI